jgi:hypothetical protein
VHIFDGKFWYIKDYAKTGGTRAKEQFRQQTSLEKTKTKRGPTPHVTKIKTVATY